MSKPAEFNLIDTYFKPLSYTTNQVQVAIGDDCAITTLKTDYQLVTSVDTMVAGRHFPNDMQARLIGYRALATAISDLAAFAAEPLWYTLALTVPEFDSDWLAEFAHGLSEIAKRFNIPLVGGDTTKGPLTITVQVHGQIAKSTNGLRSNAKPGDIVVVTGSLGDAGAGLDILNKAMLLPVVDREYLLHRFYQPTPRIFEAIAIRNYLHAAIDISDGLLQDLAHIAFSSRVDIEIYQDKLPLSESLLNHYTYKDAIELALAAGDDYELCFTTDSECYSEVTRLLAKLGCKCSLIGAVLEGQGKVHCLDKNQNRIQHSKRGYSHF